MITTCVTSCNSQDKKPVNHNTNEVHNTGLMTSN